MSALALQPILAQEQYSMAASYQQNPFTSSGQPSGLDGRSHIAGNGGGTAILMRNLPPHTSKEELRSMLLFAKDLQDADFIPSPDDQDPTLLTAVARFHTATAASEAQAMLNGKKKTARQATMMVEVISLSVGPVLPRRNTVDVTIPQGASHSISPSTNAQNTRHSSRFGGTFQSMDTISPPSVNGTSGRDIPSAESKSHHQSPFSPQFPRDNVIPEPPRVSGKSMINQDGNDDDTGELLKDPVAYMNSDYSNSMPPLSRRSTNPQISTARFAALSLNTNMGSPTTPGHTTPRSNLNIHSPNSARSPIFGGMGPNIGFQMNQQYQRHNYPPVNPADQNPPCNTLYVGNLPIDTSEDELKAMFSKQRGYKRLCFRTKQNGPMCFVEFEDVSFATKALNELYGAQLHNSVKGGIRLSFSKNPLGVRTGQPGSVNPVTPLSSPGPLSPGSFGPMSPSGNLATPGPPPGLSAPPGLAAPTPMTPSLMNGGFPDRQPMNSVRGQSTGGTPSSPGMGAIYPDYMMGR